MSHNNEDNKILTLPPLSILIRMAIPTMGGLLAIMATDLTDAFFVSLLGQQPLAALGFAFPLLLVMISLGIGLSAGMSASTARAMGAGNHDLGLAYLHYGLFVSMALGSLFATLSLILHFPLLTLIGASRPIADILEVPMMWAMAGMGILVVTMSAMGALRGRGKTSGPGLTMIAVALTNAALDPILIFGWGIIPAMGLTGSMMATFFSRLIGLVIILYLLFKEGLFARPQLPNLLPTALKDILFVGIPAALTNMVLPLANGVVLSVVARYGEAAVAGFSVATRIETVILVPFYALSSVIGPFLGQNQAAKYFDRMRDGHQQLGLFCLLLGALICIILTNFSHHLAIMFGGGTAVQDIIRSYMRYLPICYAFYGISMYVMAGFNGLHQPYWATGVGIGRSVLTMIPFVFLGSQLYDLTGIWLAMTATHILWGGLAYLILRHFIAQQAMHAPSQ
ncbi:MAG: MATE family efflux transporter [Alphaproteobacteria bacterium]|nr:MATE family efflux transporter [Alphaproteobacteria bacterium]